MRLLIGIILGVLAGLAVRKFLPPSAAAVDVQPVSTAPVVTDAPKPVAEKFPNPAYRETDAVYVKGFARWGHRVIVQLSDGTRWDNRDPKLERVEKSFVVYDGKTYPLRVNYGPSMNVVAAPAITPSVPLSAPATAKIYSGAGNPGPLVARTGGTWFEQHGEAVENLGPETPSRMLQMGAGGVPK